MISIQQLLEVKPKYFCGVLIVFLEPNKFKFLFQTNNYFIKLNSQTTVTSNVWNLLHRTTVLSESWPSGKATYFGF